MSVPVRSAHVTGWGSYAPRQVLSNRDLERLVELRGEAFELDQGPAFLVEPPAVEADQGGGALHGDFASNMWASSA